MQILALERWTMVSLLKIVYVKMVSENSFMSFSVQKLYTERRTIYGCINEHEKFSNQINTACETSIDVGWSFKMPLKVDVLEENDQICITLIHLTFTAPSLPSQKALLFTNPPPITPPPACIFPIHIHKVTQSSLCSKYFSTRAEDRRQGCKVVFAVLKTNKLSYNYWIHYWICVS